MEISKLHTLLTYIKICLIFSTRFLHFSLFVFHGLYSVCHSLVFMFPLFNRIHFKTNKKLLTTKHSFDEENGKSLFGITVMHDSLIYSIHTISAFPPSFSLFLFLCHRFPFYETESINLMHNSKHFQYTKFDESESEFDLTMKGSSSIQYTDVEMNS